jgi:hypothetical protein
MLVYISAARRVGGLAGVRERERERETEISWNGDIDKDTDIDGNITA